MHKSQVKLVSTARDTRTARSVWRGSVSRTVIIRGSSELRRAVFGLPGLNDNNVLLYVLSLQIGAHSPF